MKIKPMKKEVRDLENFKEKLRQTQESLRPIIENIEDKFSDRIRNWNAKDTKKLLNDYSLYLLMEDMLQAVDRAVQRI
jgi:hypothetical protein